MIVKATKRPWDVQSQKKDLGYYRLTETVINYYDSPLEQAFKEYRPVGPNMLTEWEEEASTSLLDGPQRAQESRQRASSDFHGQEGLLPLYEAFSEAKLSVLCKSIGSFRGVKKMNITKNSVVFYKYAEIADVGVISKVEGHEYWSAQSSHYYDDSWSTLECLTLIGPPILGVFSDEGN